MCVPILVTTHVETVCLLSKLKAHKQYIEVKIPLGGLDATKGINTNDDR